jgi:hypothetical protein
LCVTYVLASPVLLSLLAAAGATLLAAAATKMAAALLSAGGIRGWWAGWWVWHGVMSWGDVELRANAANMPGCLASRLLGTDGCLGWAGGRARGAPKAPNYITICGLMAGWMCMYVIP